MKLLPNINKSVPEAADPALIKPVSDALEALDTALGALVPVNRYNDIVLNTGGTFVNSFYDEYKGLKLLYFGFQFLRDSAATETVLVTLPSNLRPARTIYAPLMGVPASLKNGVIMITTDGNVTAYCDPAQTLFRVNVLMPYA